MVNVSSLETSFSSSEASLFRSEGGDTEKRKRADHDALATFSIIVIFNGLPRGSLCGGEKWRVVSSNRKVFFATFALDKVDQYEGNPRQSLDSGSTPWILDSLSLELGFRIPIVSGIPDSFSCIPDSKAQYSTFHKTNFQDSEYWIPDLLWVELGFRIPIVSGIPDSLSCTPDSKAQKTWFHSKTLLDSESHKRKSHRFRNLNSLT